MRDGSRDKAATLQAAAGRGDAVDIGRSIACTAPIAMRHGMRPGPVS